MRKLQPVKQLHIISLAAAILFTACNETSTRENKNRISISSDFDGGSIGELTARDTNYYVGQTKHWLQKSGSDNQYYWFYFRMNGVANEQITIQLDSLIGQYRGGPHLIYTSWTQPVFSYNNLQWNRFSDVEYDKDNYSLRFKANFTQDTVWIAYAHPYTYQMHKRFIDSVANINSKHLVIKTLGKSYQARPIDLLTITDRDVPLQNKKVILITSLQHAGETVGGFFTQGMVNFLVSDDPKAAKIRQRFVFQVIPMINPDGFFLGTTRFNAAGEDLNQEWDDDFSDSVHLPVEPEAAAVKTWIREWLSDGNKIDLALDVHSQGQEGTMNLIHAPEGVLTSLTQSLEKFWPIQSIPMIFPGSINNCLHQEFKIPSGTFEIPQSYVDEHKNYLNVKDYMNYGKGTATGINDYFMNND
ncbi:MAG: hypothetical protein EOO04_01045 [Chitinophagaceae bacterium]|nr:MAG: hypothetical protein EOO04_01045 [Chitinophagaceae bacterium]